MKKLNQMAGLLSIIAVLAFSSCQKDNQLPITSTSPVTASKALMSENGQNPDEAVFLLGENERRGPEGGYVYTESNDPNQNEILVFQMDQRGRLSWTGSTASGGAGTGEGLGSQGAVVLDESNQWLYAVNAGSNSVSSFAVNMDGSLTLAGTAGSMGEKPISVTVHNNLLYVVNAGSDNIAGFLIGNDGSLTYIDGSEQSLSTTGAGAAQIAFSPNGTYLYVTEKATNMITEFPVTSAGTTGPGISLPSVGQTPFGFEFARNNFMVVSNAAGGAEGAGSATLYKGANTGNLSDVNGAVANNQAAPCWVAITENGRFAYVTNTASNNVSSYYIALDGSLYLAEAAIASGGGPIDMVVSGNNYNAYVLNSVDHSITQYRRLPMGGLMQLGSDIGNLPEAAAGLAAF